MLHPLPTAPASHPSGRGKRGLFADGTTDGVLTLPDQMAAWQETQQSRPPAAHLNKPLSS